MLVGFVVADSTSCRSAYSAMMTCHVANDAADNGPSNAAFGLSPIDGCQANQQCCARTSYE
jgi:hypothetical protein